MFKSTSTKRERDAIRRGIMHFVCRVGKTVEEIAKRFDISKESAGNFMHWLVAKNLCDFDEQSRTYKKHARKRRPDAYKKRPPHHVRKINTPAVTATGDDDADDGSPPWPPVD